MRAESHTVKTEAPSRVWWARPETRRTVVYETIIRNVMTSSRQMGTL